MNEKKIFGGLIKILLGLVVAVFLGMHSLNFFQFTFSQEQQLFAWLGFGLTGGAAIGYLIVFISESDTPLKRVISLGMMIISVVGEIATAFYGIQVETWKKLGFELTETDYQNMLVVVMGLAFIHAIALMAYFAGDKVSEMFADADGNGKWDGFEKKKKQHQQQKHNSNGRKPELVNQYNSETDGKEDFTNPAPKK